jgi:hypothetical protein
MMGAEGVRELLRTLDLDREIETLRKDLEGHQAPKPRSRRSPSA